MPRTKKSASALETAPEGAPVPVYQLKIALEHLLPAIWRRVLVPGDVTLYKLHQVIQAVMPWQDYHLYEFAIGGVSYGDPDPTGMTEMKNARRIRLSQLVGEKGKFLYTYDFGDSWEHKVQVEKLLAPDPAVKYPVCVAGEYACPPEDCGGPPGYVAFLEAIADPEHPEHDDMLEWIGGEFDPMTFDLEEVNQALARFRW